MRTWKDVPGWFDFQDIYAEVVEERRMYTRPVRLVELGVSCGRSAIFMAELIRERVPPGSSFTFTAIDSWAGQPSPDPVLDALREAFGDWRGVFEWYARACGVRDLIDVRQADQLDPDLLAGFWPASLDLVFLDTCHTLEGTRAAIRAWLPKVRPGGIFAGHDFTPQWPGVVQAVRELLPGAAQRRSSFFWRVPS